MTKNRIVTWDTDHDVTDLVDELNDAMAAVFDGRQSGVISGRKQLAKAVAALDAGDVRAHVRGELRKDLFSTH